MKAAYITSPWRTTLSKRGTWFLPPRTAAKHRRGVDRFFSLAPHSYAHTWKLPRQEGRAHLSTVLRACGPKETGGSRRFRQEALVFSAIFPDAYFPIRRATEAAAH